MRVIGRFVVAAALIAGTAVPPLAAQATRSWTHQWFWGAHGGAYGYETNLQSFKFDPLVGGHWLITARRSALFLAYEKAFFTDSATAGVLDETGAVRRVRFDTVDRLQAVLLAMPWAPPVQPYLGLGLALVMVNDFEAEAGGEELADEASSRAFPVLVGGLQIQIGRLAVFGQYLGAPRASGFLLTGSTHSFQGGLRISLGSAKEVVESGF